MALKTLGGAAVYPASQLEAPQPLLGPGKPFALYAYLACVGERVSREQLADLLWSDLEPDAARHALRQAMWTIKKRLGDNVITADATDVGLVAPADSDRQRFIAAVARQALAEAVELYTGDFLPSFAIPGAGQFELWADLERRQLRSTFIRAADRLARAHMASGRFRDAITVAKRVRDADLDAEAGWRLLLEALLAARDTLHAAIEGDALERRLATDDREPEPSTRALLRLARQSGVPDSGSTEPPPGLVPETVGREHEFSTLLAAWDTVRSGGARRFVVSSPAGLGKTRLLTDFAARLRAKRGRVVLVRANQGDRDIPYAFISAIAAALAPLPGARTIAPQSASALVALNPTLSSYFSAAPDPALGDEAARRRMLALAELLECVSHEASVALLLDDLHWADVESRQSLRRALGRVDAARMLAVVTVRSSFEAAAENADFEQLALTALTASDVGDLLARLGSLPATAWAEALPQRLHAATDGSPLLIVETLHLALENGALALGADGWSAPDIDALDATLAAGSAINRRLEQLTRAEQWLLLLVATLAVPVEAAALARTSGQPAAEVQALLSTLERRGLVVDGAGLWQPAHDEIAEAMIGFAKPDAVRAAHQAAGRIIADADPNTQTGNVRAIRHFVHSGDIEAARPVFLRAWSRARRSRGSASPNALARLLAGPDAPIDFVDALATAVPLFERSSVRALTGVAAALLLLVGGIGVGQRLTAAKPIEPDAELVLLLEDSVHAARIVHLPISEQELVRASALEIDWKAGAEAPALAQGLSNNNTGFVGHDGRLLFAQPYADERGLELAVVEPNGTVRRLTHRPFDDGSGSFLPDGRYIVFNSGFWDPPRQRTQIGMLDDSSGTIRRLTNSPGFDASMLPSPDGTRIAFLREYQARQPSALCWVTFDGSFERCVTHPRTQPIEISAWLSDHVVLVKLDSAAVTRLAQWDLDGAISIGGQVDMNARPDPTGRFLVEPDSVAEWGIRSVQRPELVVPLRVSQPGTRITRVIWRAVRPMRGLERLVINAPVDSLDVGISWKLSVRGFDALGRAMPVSMVQWSSLDPDVANVDSSGVLVGHRVGTVRVVASAGGWRRDTTTVRVRAPTTATLLQESWNTWPSPRFIQFGEPMPRRVPVGDRGFSMLNNGDGSYSSGVYSVDEWPGAKGLAVEFEMLMPITQPQWQSISVGLASGFTDEALKAWDRRTGGIGGEHPVIPSATCTMDAPSREGGNFTNRVALLWSPIGTREAVHPAIGADRWVRVRLQLFPDGRCGVAVDGQPVLRGRATVASALRFRLIIQGNSVGTQALVGPVTVWSGVPPGVDWDALDRPARMVKR